MRWQPIAIALLLACRPTGDPGETVTQQPLPTPPTSLAGSVRDASTGLPIPTALYAVDLGAGSGLVPSKSVDANGEFLVDDAIPGGNYVVVASAPGYQTNTIHVLSVRNAVVRADLALAPAGASINVSPTTVDFGLTGDQLSFQIASTSDTAAHFQVVAPAAWVTHIVPETGTLAANGTQTVTLQVDRAQLSGYGAHSTLLTVLYEGGARFVEVRVRNVNNNAPQLSYDVAALDFGTAESHRTFDVTNVGTGSLHWSVAAGIPSWLAFQPTSGTVAAGMHQTVTVTADRGPFPPSSIADAYFALDSDSVVDTVLPIRAHLETAGSEGWTLDKSQLTLPAGTVSDVVHLSNTGTLPLDWTASSESAGVAASPASGRLLPGEQIRVYVGVDVRERPAGAFSAAITFASSVGTLPLNISGSHVITPLLEVPREVELELDGRGTVDGAAWVNNVGEGSIAWTASTTTPWITLTTTAGSSTAGLSCLFAAGACGTPLAFTVNLDAVPDGGSATGQIVVTRVGGGQSGTIQVTGMVRLAPYHWDDARPVTPAKLQRTLSSGMIYDPIRDRTVLFGGGNPQLPPSDLYADCTNGTWEFDGSSWTQVVAAANGPLPCAFGNLVYDRRTGKIMATNTYNDATYEYDGTAWTQLVAAPQERYPYTPPAWSPALRRIVMVNWQGSYPELIAWYGDHWGHIGGAPPYAVGWRFLAGGNDLILQLPSGQSFLVDALEGQPYYIAHYGPGIHMFQSASAYDPASHWYYGVSSDYVDAGRVNGVGKLLGSNVATGSAVEDTLPTDFGRRQGHVVALDSARRRLVIVGGTYCEYGCTDYTRPMPTSFLDLTAPGVSYLEHPAIGLSTTTLDFGSSATTLPITISNTGTGELDYAGELPAGLSGDVPYAAVRPEAPVTIDLTLDRAGFSPGPHALQWKLLSDGGTRTVTITFTAP